MMIITMWIQSQQETDGMLELVEFKNGNFYEDVGGV